MKETLFNYLLNSHDDASDTFYDWGFPCISPRELPSPLFPSPPSRFLVPSSGDLRESPEEIRSRVQCAGLDVAPRKVLFSHSTSQIRGRSSRPERIYKRERKTKKEEEGRMKITVIKEREEIKKKVRLSLLILVLL